MEPHVFLLTFHLRHAEVMSAAAAHAAANWQDKELNLPATIKVAHCMCRAAVLVASGVLAAGGDAAETVATLIQPRIEACGRKLAYALAQSQECELALARLPKSLRTHDELERAVKFGAALPPRPPRSKASSVDQQAAALDALQPMPSPPCDSGADVAEAVDRWIDMVSRVDHGHAPTERVALVEAERALHNEALRVLQKDRAPVPHTVGDIAALSKLCTETRRQLRRAADASSARPCLQVEYRSREALCVWVTLCIIHRCAVASWPDLLRFKLPVNPDDIRLLTLSSCHAQRAALAVAAYVAAHAGPKQQVCTTAPGNATMRMAARYVATGPSEALRELAVEQAQLARAREDEFWAAVHAKQSALRELDTKLKSVEAELASAIKAREVAFAALCNAHSALQKTETAELRKFDTARDKAGLGASADSRNTKRAKELPESAVWRAAASAAEQLKEEVEAARETMKGIGPRPSRKGSDVREDVRDFERRHNLVASRTGQQKNVKKQIAKTEAPPAALIHPLPSMLQDTEDAFAVLFWLHPEHSGFMPYFASYCFEAAQVRTHAMNDLDGNVHGADALVGAGAVCACPRTPLGSKQGASRDQWKIHVIEDRSKTAAFRRGIGAGCRMLMP